MENFPVEKVLNTHNDLAVKISFDGLLVGHVQHPQTLFKTLQTGRRQRPPRNA